MKEPDIPSILSTSDVAERFRVTPRTVRGWVRRGLLRARRDVVTRAIYFDASEVERRAKDLQDWVPGARPPSLHPEPGETMPDEKPTESTEIETTSAPAKPAARREAPTRAAPVKKAPPRKQREEPSVEDQDDDEEEGGDFFAWED